MAGMNPAAMIAPRVLWVSPREMAWKGPSDIWERVGLRGSPPSNSLSFSWKPYEWVSK